MGNQLFQIFTAITYALENSKPFFFLNNFQLGNGSNGSIIRYTYWNTFLSALHPFLRNINEIPQLTYITENNFKYQPLPKIDVLTKYGTLLVGYFQSPKYFNNYKDTIYKLLKIELKKSIVKNMIHINFNDTTYISAHFRFGDYKKYPNIYILLTETYYKNALNYIKENGLKENDVKVLYFCENDSVNEVNEIIDNLKPNFPQINFIRADPQLEDWEQMLLMSLCKHNIIANSTFSWWGAYLNTNPEKIVCYPDQWFCPEAKKDTSDLFLDDWQKILIT